MNLDAIGIVSKSIKESKRFYGILGVHFSEVGEGHWETVTTRGVQMMLDSVDLMKKINPKWKEPERGGIVLCFKQNSPEIVDKLYSQIIEAGFFSINPPWDAFWGQRYASVLDPDNNQVDIFSPLQSF